MQPSKLPRGRQRRCAVEGTGRPASIQQLGEHRHKFVARTVLPFGPTIDNVVDTVEQQTRFEIHLRGDDRQYPVAGGLKGQRLARAARPETVKWSSLPSDRSVRLGSVTIQLAPVFAALACSASAAAHASSFPTNTITGILPSLPCMR